MGTKVDLDKVELGISPITNTVFPIRWRREGKCSS